MRTCRRRSTPTVAVRFTARWSHPTTWDSHPRLERVQRREALKDRIIERRVEDLLTDADLTWSPPGMSSDREPRVSLLRPRSMEAAERAAQVGPLKHAVQVEMMPGTDMILVRGAEQDVRAFTRIMEDLEQTEAISRAAIGKRVRVDFSQAPWEDVLEWLAEQCGVTFDAVEVPPGTFSLSRSEPVPLDDIFRDIRTRLFHKGYAVELDDGNLRVRPRTRTSGTSQPTGLSSPVEIEALEGSDHVVVRGNAGDIARAAARIDELEQALTDDTDPASADPEKSAERGADHAKQELE